MADWYVSSTAYAAIPAFQASHAYTIGTFIAVSSGFVYRCTTAGTSGTSFIPAGGTNTNNSTLNTGTVTFTNVTGQSAYGWSAAAGSFSTITGVSTGNAAGDRMVAGDRCFLSSDHIETWSTAFTWPVSSTLGTVSNPVQFISVDKNGSVPPTSADFLAGATITNTTSAITAAASFYFNGINYSATVITTTNATAFRFDNGSVLNIALSNGLGIRLNNVQYKTTATMQATSIDWRNTANAFPTLVPTLLFGADTGMYATVRGVGLSALTGTLTSAGTTSKPNQVLLDSCVIAPGLTRLGGTQSAHGVTVELVNCHDGTNLINERWVASGSVTTERTIVLTNGSRDETGLYSHKMVTGTVVDKYIQQLEGFPLHTFNSIIGFTKTATVEIISSGTLNTDDISLSLEYLGNSGSPIKSFATSLCDVLSTSIAVPSSTTPWTSSPATPVSQKLQVSFIAQRSGWIRGIVCLGKASTTVYYNVQMTIL